MDTNTIFEKLKEPFLPTEIDWRIGQAGKTKEGKPWAKVLAYLNARAVMDRLDEVLGPQNWQDDYKPAPNDPEGKSVVCHLSLRIDGEWITKCDGAGNSDIEPTKGGLSDALKRAAVRWGIGRYLYDLTDNWAEILDKKCDGARYSNSKIKHDGKEEWLSFYWLPPKLPHWAIPQGQSPQTVSKPQAESTKKESTGDSVVARTGKEDPKQVASKFSEISSYVLNAQDTTTLKKYTKRIAELFKTGELTDKQADALDEMIRKREEALMKSAA